MTQVRVVTDPDVVAGLRRAWTTEDCGPIVAESPGDAGFEADFAAWWAREAGQRTTWIAYRDDQPVGMLNMLEFTRMPRPGAVTRRWGYIANVFVLAPYRNRGIGSHLLAAALAEARTRDYVRLVLSPSERSVPLYRRAGFAAADDLLLLPLDPPS